MEESKTRFEGVESILGDPKKAIWKLSIPLIISLFITSLYSVIDAVWVSSLGADALAGVGFVSPIFIALMGIGNGLGAGATSAISKYIGEGDKKKSDNGAVHAIVITVIVSIFTTLLFLIFLRDILLSMGASNTIDYAMDYGVILVSGSILVILSNSLYGVLRGEGDGNRTMYAMLFASILNMILDPIFIYYLGLGVKGAAIATLISLLFVNLLLFYWFYIKKDTYLRPFLSNYRFDKDITVDILKVGFPASLELVNNALFAALFSLLLTVVASTDAVAVYSTGWRVVTIATTPMLAVGTALISVVAANYGARRYEDILLAHRYSMKIAVLFGFIAAIVVYVFAPQIVSIFAYTGTSMRLSSQLIAFLSVIVIYFPTMGYGVTSTFLFQGTGNGITAMFQTILRETVFTLGFAIILAVVLGYGEYGAWWGIILGELVVNTITMFWADWHVKRLIRSNN
ncbi:MatE efflux family protein [Methanobrevibacter ruminantium M1]|uniref:MatE efflux family protein n=1 Tax=Methanobrevibacter ruminantium (strain ATCC 35063 / DSM 1093 / JCM 13430 / OCM 146 / M1) TaxID=634498 RepID=D3DZ51_METRM|nr:MATE family efflux transporter [Methanobrevibacter ruminantium]ADC47601.1 MatE efflux family protein [Methanobrevibacter ruminantium M1]